MARGVASRMVIPFFYPKMLRSQSNGGGFMLCRTYPEERKQPSVETPPEPPEWLQDGFSEKPPPWGGTRDLYSSWFLFDPKSVTQKALNGLIGVKISFVEPLLVAKSSFLGFQRIKHACNCLFATSMYQLCCFGRCCVIESKINERRS